jgi:two-component sensor histidine kinase
MDDQDKVYSKLWQRIGLFEVWDKSLLAFAISVTALLSYAFDMVRLDNYSLAWLPINALSFAFAIVIVISGVKIAKATNLERRFRAPLNIFLAAVAMGTKNVGTLHLCLVFGIEDPGSVFFRFLGGAAIGVSILLIYSNFRGSKIERMLIMSQLIEKEGVLRGFRNNVSTLFAEEQQEITKKTAAELLPRLQTLREKVELGATGSELAREFERLLVQDVKPLSASLADEAKKLKSSLPSTQAEKAKKLDVRVNLAKSIRPISSGLLVFFAWWMLAQIVIPKSTIIDVVVATLIYQAILAGVQLVVRPVKRATLNQALLFAPLPGTIASLPSYVLFYQIPTEASNKFLLPTFLVVGGWACISFTLAYLLDRGRAVAEEELKKLVNQFSRENKLFEQRLWVAQHVWYTLLHGTVQSALTAAAIRSSGKKVLQKSEQDAILSDLNRAIRSLKNPELAEVDFEKSLKDLQDTWLEICDISYKVAPEIWSALAKDANARLVTNEVVKESVSNAVKHGQASKVTVELSLSHDCNIQVDVQNNGGAQKSDWSPGLGSRIFDAVCLSYEIKRDEPSGLTVFSATIPLA